MLVALGALLFSLAVSASLTSASSHSGHARRNRNTADVHGSNLFARSRPYTLVDLHEGQNFFDEWSFFTGDDPTHGRVQYVSQSDAKNLAYVQEDNTTVIAVDTSNTVKPGGRRKSVRISTKKTYFRGLFIADIYDVPHGCSVWPAYWSLGSGRGLSWPDNGEIDIIEQINTATRNQITMHSGPGCTLDKDVDMLGDLSGEQCTSANGNNAGCGILQPEGTFGTAMNMQAGGVYAHTLEDDGIKVWFWPRAQVPQDVKDRTPKPQTWSKPTAILSNTRCPDILNKFYAHSLIFNIDICGDWAGGQEYIDSGCPANGAGATCDDAVANPDNFAYAQWKIASVAIYQ